MSAALEVRLEREIKPRLWERIGSLTALPDAIQRAQASWRHEPQPLLVRSHSFLQQDEPKQAAARRALPATAAAVKMKSSSSRVGTRETLPDDHKVPDTQIGFAEGFFFSTMSRWGKQAGSDGRKVFNSKCVNKSDLFSTPPPTIQARR